MIVPTHVDGSKYSVALDMTSSELPARAWASQFDVSLTGSELGPGGNLTASFEGKLSDLFSLLADYYQE